MRTAVQCALRRDHISRKFLLAFSLLQTMQSFFGPADPQPATEEAPVKLGKRKPDPAHFWSGFLSLLTAAGAANPVYKCESCDLTFQGTTRAAVHLHARADPNSTIRPCPNVNSDQKKAIPFRLGSHCGARHVTRTVILDG